MHFSGEAWSQIGSLEAVHFERLQTTLEHFAALAAKRLEAGEPQTVDLCVPITAGSVIAECVFDDVRRTVTVSRIEVWNARSVA